MKKYFKTNEDYFNFIKKNKDINIIELKIISKYAFKGLKKINLRKNRYCLIYEKSI